MPNDSCPTPTRLQRHNRSTIAVFIVAVGLLVGGDLLLKWWAFRVSPLSIRQVMAEAHHRQDEHYQQTGRSLPVGYFVSLPSRDINVVPGVLTIKLVLNTGAVFGIGQGKTWVFLIVTLIALGVIGWTFATHPPGFWLLHLSLMLILAGALGNAYDRLMHGAVRDMLNLFPDANLPFGWNWPGGGGRSLYPWVFNLADVYLVVGIALMMLRTMIVGSTKQEPSPEKVE